ELGCAQIEAFQKPALIELNRVTEIWNLGARDKALELKGVDQKSAGFKCDRVAGGDQRMRVTGRQNLAQQAERLTQALPRLHLRTVFPKQGGEFGPFVRLSGMIGKVCQQRLCLFGW